MTDPFDFENEQQNNEPIEPVQETAPFGTADSTGADFSSTQPQEPASQPQESHEPPQSKGAVPPTPQSFQQPYGAQGPYQGRPGEPRSSYYQQPRPQMPYQPYGYNQSQMMPPEKKDTGKKIAIIVLAIAVVFAFAAFIGSYFLGRNAAPHVTDESTSAQIQNETGTDNNDDSMHVIDYGSADEDVLSAVEIAKKCRISVVGVMTYQNGKLSGEGSGVVLKKDDTGKFTYIITCAHVIKGRGLTYGILTLDEKRYEAQMVAYDERTDIGVLKVEATDLTPAQFGDSNLLEIGETVYAIGNPGGSEYFGSITNGIISAIDRSISSTYTLTSIQHNAAINPGNSGGALVNSKGQVIGINSSKIAATDYEGMGFAVPTSTVVPIVESLIKYNYVPNRPKLGIQYASVSSYQMYSMVVAIKGLPAGSLVIAGISNDSDLAQTDAQVGDLIIAVNGKDMNDSSVLLDLIDKGAVGDTLTLTLCRVESRTYKTSTFDVTIKLVEDKGSTQEEETTTSPSIGGYNYGGANSFEDFFREYFGGFGF